MTFQIVGQRKIPPDLCCPLPMNIQSEIDEEDLDYLSQEPEIITPPGVTSSAQIFSV